MYKDLIDKINSIPKSYDGEYQKEKQTDANMMITDVLKYESLNSLLEHEYIKDIVEAIDSAMANIDKDIVKKSKDLSPKHIREITVMNGKKEALEELYNKFILPDIKYITSWADEELKYINEQTR